MDTHPRLTGRSRVLPLAAALIGALVAIAVAVVLTHPRTPPPDSAGLRARLAELRNAITTYRNRNGHGPATLHDLVSAKLLREVPEDPITHSRATWRVITEESVAVQQDFGGAGGGAEPRVAIIEVHSGAPGNDPDGRAWSSY